MDDLLEKIRALHVYTDLDFDPICVGCDSEITGYEYDMVRWPCETASFVYSAEEIAEVADAQACYKRWTKEWKVRKHLATVTWEQDQSAKMMRSIYDEQIRLQLTSIPFFSANRGGSPKPVVPRKPVVVPGPWQSPS